MSVASAAPFKSHPALKNLQVLVVDDDKKIAKLLRGVLMGLGFESVEVCHDCATALSVLESRKVDMMICDWQMEPMSGTELVQQLRSRKGLANQAIPVIMLSGNSEKPQIEMARDIGVTEYVMKPFTARSLCSRIVAVIENPRSFVLSKGFVGHNRRRKNVPATQERRRPKK